jgi:hypothetical protein
MGIPDFFGIAERFAAKWRFFAMSSLAELRALNGASDEIVKNIQQFAPERRMILWRGFCYLCALPPAGASS